jgi:hypothetical protein
VRVYDRLFSAAAPGKGHEDGDFLRDLNPDSLKARRCPSHTLATFTE